MTLALSGVVSNQREAEQKWEAKRDAARRSMAGEMGGIGIRTVTLCAPFKTAFQFRLEGYYITYTTFTPCLSSFFSLAGMAQMLLCRSAQCCGRTRHSAEACLMGWELRIGSA